MLAHHKILFMHLISRQGNYKLFRHNVPKDLPNVFWPDFVSQGVFECAESEKHTIVMIRAQWNIVPVECNETCSNRILAWLFVAGGIRAHRGPNSQNYKDLSTLENCSGIIKEKYSPAISS